MITIEDISQALKEHSRESGYFIVDILLSNNKISIFVDSLSRFSISDCATINKWLRKKYGESLDIYELIVSTPGLDQPLKTIEQFQKNIGREVEVLQKDGKKITGKLLANSENQFTIETEKRIKTEKGKKELVKNKFDYKMEDIKSIKVVIKI